ncbi:CGNR zinc finger domain-containing protein [Leifsonia kafniensis]|uniref:CGNR zinc finger domain-containing protein n=1 Tax=Leifsonia kafniensis TaxID=475957 RepID=A0ABP7L847_9MICO
MTLVNNDTARPGQTGQWLISSDGQRWWFDSGSIALDFAYTGDLGDNPAGELLHTAGDLADWLNERYSPQTVVTDSAESSAESLSDSSAADSSATSSATASVAAAPTPRIQTQERDLADALALRGAIARLATAAADGRDADGQDIDIVNLFAATPDIPPALTGGSRQAGRTSPRAGQAFSTLARTAVELFGPDTDGRIRYCSADDCTILYLDTSRSANRRWCSMQRCGNRAKVRAFRERNAASAATSAPATSATESTAESTADSASVTTLSRPRVARHALEAPTLP